MLSLAVGRAHAQSADTSTLAEQLFNEARDLARANQWPEACTKFEASLRYDSALGTRLNLATCYEHIGKLASAWGLYRESSELASKAGDVKRHDYAEQQAAALEPRLPRLAIAPPDRQPPGFAVKRDDTAIDAGALGTALYVDPGPHGITASAPGFEAFTQTITLVEGKTETIAIPELKAAPVPPPRSPKPPANHHVDRTPAAEPAVRVSRIHMYIALSSGVTGVAAVGVSLVFGTKANSSFNDAKALCGVNLVCSPDDYSKGQQLIHDARSHATTSTVFITAGAVAIAAGAIVYLTAPRTRERTAARLVPIAHPGDVGLALLGRF
ncbi:MAG TPA: hypothetical protein VFT22_05510 [Kofleriaceae bacterium]|nr:hypothetical protein [Kofleriaceae bacterium]